MKLWPNYLVMKFWIPLQIIYMRYIILCQHHSSLAKFVNINNLLTGSWLYITRCLNDIVNIFEFVNIQIYLMVVFRCLWTFLTLISKCMLWYVDVGTTLWTCLIFRFVQTEYIYSIYTCRLYSYRGLHRPTIIIIKIVNIFTFVNTT